MIWYIENLGRFKAEQNTLDQLAAEVDWLELVRWRLDDSNRLILDADIRIGETTYPVSLRYPTFFPHTPPSVVPRDKTAYWSDHQYGAGGDLCLEFGPDNWQPELTGVDLIQSAHRLLQTEQPDDVAPVPSRHAITTGQDVRNRYLRFTFSAGAGEALLLLPEGHVGKATLRSVWREDTLVVTISSLVEADGREWKDLNVSAGLTWEGLDRSCQVIRISEKSPLPPVTSGAEFLAKLSETLGCPITLDQSMSQMVLVAQGQSIHCYWVQNDLSNTVSKAISLPAWEIDRGVRSTHREILGTKKVAIVGCGSVGSKTAVTLARAGVGAFLLVDDDLMLPENLVRSELDWSDVGTHKADAVAHRISLVSPSAKCRVRKLRLAAQEASGGADTLLTALGKCSLIIDTTANPKVFNLLSAIVAATAKPLVWAEVFGGGIGGMLARSRPGIDATPQAIRRSVELWCDEKGTTFPVVTGGYEVNGPDSPMIAEDAHVSAIAAHGAQLALDSLLESDPSSFPFPVYLVGMAAGWIFTQAFEVYPIEVPRQGQATEASNLDQEQAAAAVASILAMFQDRLDVDPSS